MEQDGLKKNNDIKIYTKGDKCYHLYRYISLYDCPINLNKTYYDIVLNGISLTKILFPFMISLFPSFPISFYFTLILNNCNSYDKCSMLEYVVYKCIYCNNVRKFIIKRNNYINTKYKIQ